MKEISNEGIKVFLNGQGSDEVFLGYDRYFVSYVLSGDLMLKSFSPQLKIVTYRFPPSLHFWSILVAHA